MKAAICTKYGPPEVIQVREVLTPQPREDQMLVRIVASALNSGDVRVRGLDVTGWMKLMMRLIIGYNKPRNPILGTVYAGVVEQVGSQMSEWNVGDKVFGMQGFKFGTHAEYVLLNKKSLVEAMPDNATFEQAVSLVFGGQTAIHFLQKAGIPNNHKSEVLILGASGSVGSSAIQIAQHYGAQITAVCGSSGGELMKELGVQNFHFYDKTSLSELKQTFDFVFDAVGKCQKKECQHLLKPTGVFKTVGGMEYASESKEQLEILKNLFEKGELKAVIDKTFTLDQILEAHRYVDKGRKKGNVIIQMNPS